MDPPPPAPIKGTGQNFVHGELEEQPADGRLNLQAKAPDMPHIRIASYVPILEPGGTTPVDPPPPATSQGNRSELLRRVERTVSAQLS